MGVTAAERGAVDGADLTDTPAFKIWLLRQTQPATPPPEEAALSRMLDGWFVEPLVRALVDAGPADAPNEAIGFWRRAVDAWRVYSPKVTELLLARSASGGVSLAGADHTAPNEWILAALERHLPHFVDYLPNLSSNARAVVRAFQYLLARALWESDGEVRQGIEVFTAATSTGTGTLTASLSASVELDAYFALAQALAVAGLDPRVPQEIGDALAREFWTAFCGLADDANQAAFETALRRAKDSAPTHLGTRYCCSLLSSASRLAPRGLSRTWRSGTPPLGAWTTSATQTELSWMPCSPSGANPAVCPR